MSAAVSALYTYLGGVASRFCWQLFQLLGIACLLALLLQWSGRRLRKCGLALIGKWYWYFVSPGVICHEAGHAVGCFITGTRLQKMIPFKPEEDGTLGYVLHEQRKGVLGGWANFVIATGPLWFGGMAIVLLSALFSGGIPIASYGACFADGQAPGVAAYVRSLIASVIDAFLLLVHAERFGWRFVLWLYLSFSIASEIGLSKEDVMHMKNGFVHLLILLLLLNLIPFVGQALLRLVSILLPAIFILHAMMLFSLTVNCVMLGALLLLRRFKTR